MSVQRHLCGRQTLTESRKSSMTDRLLFQILFLERVVRCPIRTVCGPLAPRQSDRSSSEFSELFSSHRGQFVSFLPAA